VNVLPQETDSDGVALTSAAQAEAGRDRVLALVDQAARCLHQAAVLSAPLVGWAVPCDRLRTKARETQMLHDKIRKDPAPVGHSQFPNS